jgi:hypothetical protein
MNIEYYHWVGHEEFYEEFQPEMSQEKPMKEIFTIDIDENLPIQELLSKLYELTNTSPYLEIEWDGKVEKVASSCYFKHGAEYHDFRMIDDVTQRIKDFPKLGPNGELCLHINMTIAYGN